MNDSRATARARRSRQAPKQAPSFSLDTVKGPLAVFGLVLIVASLGYYLIVAAFDTPMRIMLAVGILLVGVAVAIDPEALLGKMRTRGALYGGNTLALAAIVLGILALVNVLGARRHERFDLTSNKQFSISDETVKVLQQLDQPVRILAFFSFDDTRRQEFQDLLREYQIRSPVPFEYEFIDPLENPVQFQQLGLRELGTTVLLMGDRRQQITSTREQDLTSALLKLVRANPYKAYFTVGHNEHRLDGFDQDGYSQIKTSLEQRNFVVEPLNLFASGSVPEDASLVVVGGPKTAFDDDERGALKAYLDRGGKLMVLFDPKTETGLGPLFSEWSIELGQAYVAETDPNANARTPFIPVISRFPVHKITEDMFQVVFITPTYVGVPKETPRNLTITSIAQTTERSWVETDETALTNPQAVQFDEGADTRGPLSLGVAVEVRPEATGDSQTQSPTPRPRIVLFSTSRLVTNEVFRLNVANPTLFLNAANWLIGEEELISIPAKPQDNRQIFMTSAQRNFVFYSSTLFLPVLVLAAGAAVWWSRR